MKNFNAFYLIIFLSITLFSCCKDEPKCQDPTKIECENYDPCYGKKPISAAFKIEELVGNRWFETDTVARKVKFTKNLLKGMASLVICGLILNL
jgi:hypothetical protein